MADNSVRTPGSGETIRTIEKSAGAFKTSTAQLDIGSGTTESLVTSANPLPIYAPDATQTAQNLATASTANAVTISGLNTVGGVTVQITGTWTGTLIFEGCANGTTTYFSTPLIAINGTGVLVTTTTANGQWQGDLAGYSAFRVRCSVTGTGTAVVSIRGSAGIGALAIDSPLPAGTNTIGAVNIAAAQTLATVTTVSTVTTVTTLTNITNWGNVADNAAFTDGTTRLSMSGYILDETAGTALTENDAAAARIDSKRAQVHVIEDATTRGQRQAVNASGGASVTPTPHTAGGASIFHLIGAGSTNATNIKASAGQVLGWSITNNTASWRYVKLHNTAGTPTAGAGVILTIGIPPGGGNNKDLPYGIPFATGIAMTTVTGIADADTAAIGASELNINIEYK